MATTDDEARAAGEAGRVPGDEADEAGRRRRGRGNRSRPGFAHVARRYAPVLVVVVALAAFVAVRGGGGGSDERPVPAAEVDREALVRSGPMTPEKAELVGEDPAAVDFGPRCDPETGRIRMPSVYAPPCVERFTGDNGGATATGVTADAIRLVAYVPGQSAGQLEQSTLASAGVERGRREQETAIRNYVQLYNRLFETYGRRVEVEVFTGTGGPDDEAAAQADAIAIAEQEPFAVIGGPDQVSPTFADELAARGVVCLEGCAVGLNREFLDEHAPYVWLPNVTAGRSLLGEAVGKLAGPGPAVMAGDPEMRRRDRVYAVVHYDTPDGFYRQSFEDLRDELAEYDIEIEVDQPYVLDVNRVQETARTVVARLEASGVTTVVFAGDPITPTSLTAVATEQGYFPEWIHGSGYLVDSSLFARTFDGRQWANGFGLASSVPAAPELETHNQVYEWAYGSEPPNSARVLEPGLRALFIGVHLAGAELTPESFGDGLLRYPPSGGGPTRPRTAYNGVDGGDTALIQWDPDAEGVAGGEEGRGMYRFLRDGTRYAPGEMPSSPGAAGLSDFGESVVQYGQVPTPDRTPDYTVPS